MGRIRRRSGEEQSEGAPEWLVTYSDLVTLLLTFFIMLFSMATIDKQKLKVVAQSLQATFSMRGTGDMLINKDGDTFVDIFPDNSASSDANSADDNKQGGGGKNDQTDQQNMDQQELQEQNEKKLEELKEKVEAAIGAHQLMGVVEVIDKKSTLVLRVNQIDGILFDTGKADIKPEGETLLLKIGEMIKDLENEITIEGHTDNRPINTAQFPSNWELSTKRATNVVKLLVEKCNIPERNVIASGRAEFDPVAPNDTLENMQKNRRIDIVITRFAALE